jgi:hypothetical protein
LYRLDHAQVCESTDAEIVMGKLRDRENNSVNPSRSYILPQIEDWVSRRRADRVGYRCIGNGGLRRAVEVKTAFIDSISIGTESNPSTVLEGGAR